MSAVNAAALPVWTYDEPFGDILDEKGDLVAELKVDSLRASAVGPLLAAAPLVPALARCPHDR